IRRGEEGEHGHLCRGDTGSEAQDTTGPEAGAAVSALVVSHGRRAFLDTRLVAGPGPHPPSGRPHRGDTFQPDRPGKQTVYAAPAQSDLEAYGRLTGGRSRGGI